MRVVFRALILLMIFVGVGWFAAHAVMVHSRNRGTMEPEVRLAGAMAGLFAGGAVTLIAGIAMAWQISRKHG